MSRVVFDVLKNSELKMLVDKKKELTYHKTSNSGAPPKNWAKSWRTP
jgi:hypothetical protein